MVNNWLTQAPRESGGASCSARRGSQGLVRSHWRPGAEGHVAPPPMAVADLRAEGAQIDQEAEGVAVALRFAGHFWPLDS
jgi:hypothetical protein